MNSNERTMKSLLEAIRTECGGAYVRAEFEAEGLAIEDLLRLKEVSLLAGLPLSLKIGGCEGVRDLLETKVIGCESIVAPMIESPFALRKYAQALRKVYNEEESEFTSFWFNLETENAFRNLDGILAEDAVAAMKGVVIERVDLCFSQGRSADEVDTPEIAEMVDLMARRASERGLKVTVGGGVSARSAGRLIELRDAGILNHVETRKVGFDLSHPGLDERCLKKGILMAVAFEVLFLENRRHFRAAVNERDRQRAEYLKSAYGNAIKEIVPGLQWGGAQ